METTPKKVTSRIKKFLKRAELYQKPTFLYLHKCDADYAPNFCLDNCKEEVSKNGGKMIFGWVIWEKRRKGFIEAEFHAVVERNGKLLDITPRVDREERILFVRDPHRVATLENGIWKSWENIRLIGDILKPTRERYSQSRYSKRVK